MSRALRAVVPTGCVDDRAPGPYEASLFDMGRKDAGPMPRDALLAAAT
jgi:hypothetical protein